MTMVNAKIPAIHKAESDLVLSDADMTWSSVIQSLARYMAESREIPAELTKHDKGAEISRKLAALGASSGWVNSGRPLTDDESTAMVNEAREARHGR